jgi:translation initiation factor IF-2
MDREYSTIHDGEAQSLSMEETTEKSKKVTVRTLATELNISHDTLIEFLHKKGYTSIKTIMSKVDDEALETVHRQFSKEKDVTEKRHKKVAAFKEKRSKSREDADPKHDAPAVELEESQPAPVVVHHEVDTQTIIAEHEVAESPLMAVDDQIAAAHSEEVVAHPEQVNVVHAAHVEEDLAEVHVPLEATHHPEAVEHPHEDMTSNETHEDTTGPDGVKRRRRKRKTTTVVATSDPTDLRVTLPGLKIKGKIELGIAPAKQREAMPLLRTKSERLGNKVQGLVSKHRTDGPVKEGAATTEEEERGAKKKRGRDRGTVDARNVADAVKRTLAGIEESSQISNRARARKSRRRERAETEEMRSQEEIAREEKLIRATEFLTANELANLMKVEVGEIISKCIALGLMVSINQRLDHDTIQLVADEFGYRVEFQDEFTTDALDDEPDEPETLKPRAPVVTIMGHVDHGKTSLLDYIRKANVVAGESGGITQHIGAYEVTLPDGRQVTFLDTPGHEAFTAMRARGAQATDIVVLVIAADDSVMPQTWEAISHAQAASVPIIIAFNKTDRPDANPDRIRQQLADKNVLVEEWGGKYGTVELSAKTGKNVDLLLDRILLESELLDLKANPDREARGIVIEAEVDKGRGIQVTVLVQKGTLKLGDPFIAGIYAGRVRAMFDERGNRVEVAPPSTPVQLLGFDGIPQAGDQFIAVESDSEAKHIAGLRQQLKREQDFKQVKFITLDDISAQIKQGGVEHLRLILKGDVDGSVEAIADSLLRLSTPEVVVEIVHRAVGAISENDVSLAAASNAIILGFHVRPNLDARKLAAIEHVEVRLYSVIYDCINDVRDALEGLLSPEEKEEVTATVEVREVFKVPKIGTVAGCYVQEGKIVRNNRVRLLREGVEVFTGGLASLRRFKDDVREVETGYECGLGLENFNDVKVGDIIEAFKVVEVKRTLEKVAAARV